jgi:hypothetical protein
MYREAAPGSVLAEAVAALAFANYGARFSSAESKQMAFRRCGNALNLLQRAIDSPIEALTNEIMISITLLGMYEVGACLHVHDSGNIC